MLIEATDADFDAILSERNPAGLRIAPGGLESQEILEMLRGLACTVRETFEPAAWMIVEANEVVGLLSLIRIPSGDGAIEIGYGVAASRRRRGACRTAIADLVAWAVADERVLSVWAENSPGNPASQRVLESNGFIRAGDRVDAEDGPVVRWRIATGAAPAAA